MIEKLDDPIRLAVGLPLGPDGAYFTGADPHYGLRDPAAAIDHNAPPAGQPALWCQWVPTADGAAIERDGEEKFYCGAEWIAYLIDHFLEPWGYNVSGAVTLTVSEFGERGTIRVLANRVKQT